MRVVVLLLFQSFVAGTGQPSPPDLDSLVCVVMQEAEGR
jgi:hypothetical protein